MKKGKGGRPKKTPGDGVAHRLTPAMEIAITAIVEDNLPRAEAAKLAGLTDSAVRKSMQNNSATRAFYSAAVKSLLTFAKAKAAHALIKELDGSNATARVSAARILLEDSTAAQPGTNMPQQPGFTIQIVDARAPQQALPVATVIDQIAHEPSRPAE